MASLKERLERLVANPNPVAPDGTPMATAITAKGAAKVLALLAAAKELPGCYADPECQMCQDTLKRVNAAIAAVEEE